MLMATMIDALCERRVIDPGRMFCQFGERQMTYEEFGQRVEACAAGLESAGVGPGHRVVVMLDHHPDHIVLVYALAWVGAVHVPASTHLKATGLATQIESAQPELIVSEVDYKNKLTDACSRLALRPELLFRGNAIRPNGRGRTLEAVLNSSKAGPNRDAAGSDRIGMIAYTSGTTGPPKGAQLTEHRLQFGAANTVTLAKISSTDRLFHWEPFYHLGGWLPVYAAMNTGASVMMVPRFSASRCWTEVRELDATRLHYLGGVIKLLLNQDPRPSDGDNPVDVAWGAGAPRDGWEEFEQRFNLKLREGYGITEGQSFVTMNLDDRPGSIGRPISDIDVWVESETGGKAAPRDVGELILRPRRQGITMSGYYNDDAATAEVMVGDTIRTGDLAYADEDGYLYFAGRSSDSLRRRGENISAWEVESVVDQHPDVVMSAVLGVPSPLGEEDMKLLVERREGVPLSEHDLLKWCRERLAYYQTPRYIEFVEKFPLGPSQRIRKTVLSRKTSGIFDAEAL